MRLPVVLLSALFILSLLVGCRSTAAQADPDPFPPPAGGDIVRFSGAVTYVPLEGGFYALISDQGERFDAGPLPPSFREDGLRVTVTGRKLPRSVGFHMWGTRIEILNIEKE